MSATAPFTLAMITDSTGTVFLLDVCLSDQHDYQSQITSDPIEDGSNLTDNIINDPIAVTMDCLVSNAPIHPAIIDARSGMVAPSTEAYQFLIACRDAREPITVRTSLDTFVSMGIERLGIPRVTGRGDELRFTLSLKQMNIVKNQRTVRTASPVGKPSITKNKPNKNTASKMVLISTAIGKWLDENINAWRLKAVQGTNGTSFLEGDRTRPLGSYVCYRGCPDGIEPFEWVLATDERKKELENEVLLAHPFSTSSRPFADSETLAALKGGTTIITVPQFQVTFGGLSPSTG